jgi:hypothetical protein
MGHPDPFGHSFDQRDAIRSGVGGRGSTQEPCCAGVPDHFRNRRLDYLIDVIRTRTGLIAGGSVLILSHVDAIARGIDATLWDRCDPGVGSIRPAIR